MTTTINNDAFEDDFEHNYEPYSIVYGKTGVTDSIDDATVELLLNIGAIQLFQVVSGVGFETRIYLSVEGRIS